jgi:hypothetical protein
LFIAVLEHCFRSLKQRWHSLNQRRVGHHYGIVIDDIEDPLSNLRFADDVVLVALSREDVVKTLTDLRQEAAKYGQLVHLGKTKLLTTKADQAAETVAIGASHLDILPPCAGEKYLGRMLCLGNYHDAEIMHRMRAAWAAFARLRHVLFSRKYPLHSRLKLFDAAVSTAALYACGSWAMNAARKKKLRTTWRTRTTNRANTQGSRRKLGRTCPACYTHSGSSLHKAGFFTMG